MSEKVKLIIEIPKYYLKHPQDYACLAECVRRGTPLPKGHGRLIDADAIEYDEESLETDSSQVFLVVDKDSIDLMPTIVEADKENDT